MSPTTERMDDRRAALVAAGLVAAVVAVLGFGSGVWSDLAERTGSLGAASGGRNLGTVVQGGPVAAGITPGDGSLTEAQPIAAHTAAHLASPAGATVTTAVTHTAHAGTSPTTNAPSTSVPTAGASVVAAACSAGTVAPFWTHFEKAHLETSPGQQADDALDLDQYVKTHTVLVEAMVSPIVEAVLGSPGHPGPFWAHLAKAHLETSPGQQVDDALDLDQYVKTHTVLVEDILAPIVGTC